MPNNDPKQKLIGFLDRRAWRPILKASSKKYEGADAKRLDRVQKKTESQRERYQSYASAGEVLKRFRGDLSSQAAKKVDADLQALHLPTQADVADEFFQLAERLKVKPQRGSSHPHKPHPPHPWHKSKAEDRKKASAKLKKEARQGNRAAINTLKNAPRKWARDYAQQVTKRKSARKKKGR
jgi:hypothetical protein